MLRTFIGVATFLALRRAHLEPPRRNPSQTLRHVADAKDDPGAERIPAPIGNPVGSRASGPEVGESVDLDESVAGPDQAEEAPARFVFRLPGPRTPAGSLAQERPGDE